MDRAERKQFIENWIHELCYGDWEQAIGSLRRGDHYCCLGVACSLHPDTQWVVDSRPPPGSSEFIYSAHVLGSKTTTLLPSNLRKEIGISFDFMLVLSSLNDSGASFEAIASLIRYEFRELLND